MPQKFISCMIFLCFCTSLLFAQGNTEVYLFDLKKDAQGFSISNAVNISDNAGYDNQPYFLSDGSGLLFSSTRKGQTDVVLYTIGSGQKKWLTNSEGSEYSPTAMPDGKHFSTIILEEDGTQQLWQYPLTGGEATLLIDDVVIGYYAWHTQNLLYAFVLGEPATLQKLNLKTGNYSVLTESPGRSIHKIPGSDNISYVDKSDSTCWFIKSIDPKTDSTQTIAQTLKGSEDMAWSGNGYIFMGSGSSLFVNNPARETGWQKIADFTDYHLGGITRIAISPTENNIAVVVQQ